MTDKEKMEQLIRENEQMKATVQKLAKDEGQKNGHIQADAIHKDELEKMTNDVADKVYKKIQEDKKKAIGNNLDKGMLNAGGEVESISKFLTKVKSEDHTLQKANLVEGTGATGGYLVPTGLASTIYGAVTNTTTIVPKTMPFPHAMTDGYVKNIPKWLTNVTVYWPGEVTAGTLSNPTWSQKTSTLKVVVALVPESAELQSDNIVGLDRQLTEKVSEAIAYELEKLVLCGDVTGSSHPFNGIAYTSGIHETNCSGESLTYNKIVDIWNNPSVLEQYRIGAEWYFNRNVLGVIMKMVDGNSRPLWSLQPINNTFGGFILGAPVNISATILNTLGDSSNTTKIFYGNYKNVLMGYKEGDTTMTVEYNKYGYDGTNNYWTQNMIGWRFMLRRSITVVNPDAFSVGDEVPYV